MECPNCRTENREGARFCRACGTRLAAASTADQPSSAQPTSAPGVEAQPLPRAAPALEPTLSSEASTGVPGASSATVESRTATEQGAWTEPMQETEPCAEKVATLEETTVQAMPAPGLQPQVAPAVFPAESFEPLLTGAIIAGRFEILELLRAGPDVNLYAAYDRGVCPQCGTSDNAPGEPFCNNCGVELKSAGPPVKCQLREARSPDALGLPTNEALADGGRFYARLIEEAAPISETTTPSISSTSADRSTLTLNVGYGSHVGMVRELDEDSLCVFTLAGVYESVADPVLGLFIVADGMGGHEGGEVASKMTVQLVARGLIRRLLLRRFLEEFQGSADAVPVLITNAIAEANKKIYDLAQQRGTDMGSTITLALVMDGTAYIANIGDSRTYLYREGKLRQITTDHSLVASLVTAGVLAPEEIFTHPDRSVIYRSIGAKPTVEVDIFKEPLTPGDTLLLCCDGLWEAIRDEGIEEVLLSYSDLQAACGEMISRANLAGGEDNISVIMVRAGVPAK